MGLPYYLETYGCQMNEYDSLIAHTILQNSQYYQVNTPEEAKLILINTCSVRENAHQKIYNRLKSIAHLHRNGARIAVMGCMAQSLGEELLKSDLPVNFIIGPDELRNLGVLNNSNNGDKQVFVKNSKTETYDDIIPSIDLHSGFHKESLSANVAIQRGCDKFCTFCVVPFTRGRERSRPVQSIINEVRALSECGIKTVVLLGQNVNSYMHEGSGLTDLIEAILNDTDISRIYYTSPNPQDFPEKLIEMTAREKRIGSQVHIPLQAGDNEVLKRMRRDYTREEFIRLVQNFKDKVEDVSISTDLIVGFPGETDAQFRKTLDAVEICQFDFAYMFAYSEREHTSAQKIYPDDISAFEKQQRLDILIKMQLNIADQKNQKYVNQVHDILIEGISKKNKLELTGSLRNSKKVILPIPEGQTISSLLGKEVKAHINSAGSQTLKGIIV
ncbi:MAG: tRNA (N6-isopentenyl adenosine(37)-C2)-methylthiotransferase MiaB [Spirochaetia bacterium]|nr:tRNA (N6-isopentenyl adenosine(37)-C2)-methylthiotransferase MiaB [Spirochaetia bacterium]